VNEKGAGPALSLGRPARGRGHQTCLDFDLDSDVHRYVAVTTSIQTVPEPQLIPCGPKLCALLVLALPRCPLSLAMPFLATSPAGVNSDVLPVTVVFWINVRLDAQLPFDQAKHQARTLNRVTGAVTLRQSARAQTGTDFACRAEGAT
jgi:hypothetical protein